MKKLLIALGLLVVTIILFHAALFIFLNLKGREIIIANLEKNFGQEVEIESLRVSFPFAIELKGFECADISFDKANAYLDLFNPFRRLAVAKLIVDGLKINIVNDRRGLHVLPFFEKGKPQGSLEEKLSENQPTSGPATNFVSKKAAEAGEPEIVKIIPVTIKDIRVINSRIEFEDKTNREAKPIIIKDVDIKLTNFSFPDPEKFYLKAKGFAMVGETSAVESISANGWVDYYHKNMDLDVSLDDIGYNAFSSYWPVFWKPESWGIKQASLSLNSNLNSKENELVIESSLVLENIEYSEVPEGQEESSRTKTLRTILSFLKGPGDKPVFNFVIKTKMDSPNLNLTSIKDSLKEVVPFGSLMVQGVADNLKENIGDKLKEGKELTLDETIDVFKKSGEEIVDTLKSIFVPKKNKETSEQQPAESQN